MKLMLAIDIADRLRDAQGNAKPFDIETEARALLKRHPEAHATVDEVIATMRGEMHGRPEFERPAVS